MITELTKEFLQQEEKDNAEKMLIEDQIEQKRRSIQRLQEQLDRLEAKKMDDNENGWIHSILVPFSKVIAEKLGWTYEICGPFGEDSRVTIYFYENPEVALVAQTTKSITIVPKYIKSGQLHYDTGKRRSGVVIKNPFTAGLNGNMNEILPIPDSLEKVIEILDKNLWVK
ncbi:hypothetical protein [Bacillus sp. Brlt_9]|uniref:hypothetical protein n=1 Tax=Bacillus sp. Brlt_9 TaxID=3110916 RepID=UPI003F7CAEFB